MVSFTLFDLSLTILLLIFNTHPQTVRLTFAWNFSDVGLSQNILIWRFTIWRNRAYLAVPRWDEKSKPQFTLLEAPWPETAQINRLQVGAINNEIVPFPDAKSQEEGICEDLQSITGIDTDLRGRLWVLDAPILSQCKPKIVIYDLRRNEKVAETNLDGISPHNLKCLVVDPVPGQWGTQAYVSDPGNENLIVYSLAQRSWWRLKLTKDRSLFPRIFTTDLAVSRKSSVLYFTGYQSDDLFGIDLDPLRNGGGYPSFLKNDSLIGNSTVSWVGSKLGSSSGLFCDLREGLHYFMMTEMASVRWDSKEKLEAEGHSVIVQSEAVPCVTDYAFDSQKNVWAIVNERHPLRKGKGKSGLSKYMGNPKRRTIKVWKYNPFIF